MSGAESTVILYRRGKDPFQGKEPKENDLRMRISVA